MRGTATFINKNKLGALQGVNKNVDLGEALLQLLSPEAGRRTEGE
jgi:hypothetical protein